MNGDELMYYSSHLCLERFADLLISLNVLQFQCYDLRALFATLYIYTQGVLKDKERSCDYIDIDFLHMHQTLFL